MWYTLYISQCTIHSQPRRIWPGFLHTYPAIPSLGPFRLCFVAPDSNSMETSTWRYLIIGNRITTNLCTDHNSTAVVSCATFSSDHVIIIKIEVTAKRNFISNLNYEGKYVSGMGAALSLPTYQSNIDHSHHCSSDPSSQSVTLAVARK